MVRTLRSAFILLTVLLTILSAGPSLAEQQNSAVQIAVDELPRSFSPYASSPLELQYAHLFFDPLVRWGKSKKIEKRLVNKWEVIRPGVMRFF